MIDSRCKITQFVFKGAIVMFYKGNDFSSPRTHLGRPQSLLHNAGSHAHRALLYLNSAGRSQLIVGTEFIGPQETLLSRGEGGRTQMRKEKLG